MYIRYTSLLLFNRIKKHLMYDFFMTNGNRIWPSLHLGLFGIGNVDCSSRSIGTELDLLSIRTKHRQVNKVSTPDLSVLDHDPPVAIGPTLLDKSSAILQQCPAVPLSRFWRRFWFSHRLSSKKANPPLPTPHSQGGTAVQKRVSVPRQQTYTRHQHWIGARFPLALHPFFHDL
jgi:hypothetical protein